MPRPRSSSPAKRFLTTGAAAELCGCSQQSIIRAIDTGKLEGFRVPGSKFRRVARQTLYAYMRANRIPVDLADPQWGGFRPEAQPQEATDENQVRNTA